MNNTFDFSRFGKVFVKDLRSIYPLFGRALIGLAAVPILSWMWCLLTNNYAVSPDSRQNTTFIILMIVLMIAPAILYGNCNRMRKGIHFAMLPASKLEKYLSMIVITAVVCPVVYLLATLVIDLLLTLLPFGPFVEWIWQADDFGFSSVIAVGSEVATFPLALYTCVNLLLTSSLFLFTNTIIKKHKALNTILWMMLLSFVLSIVGVSSLEQVAAWIENHLLDWVQTHTYEEIANRLLWIATSVQLVVAVGLYVWGGLRLKKMCY